LQEVKPTIHDKRTTMNKRLQPVFVIKVTQPIPNKQANMVIFI